MQDPHSNIKSLFSLLSFIRSESGVYLNAARPSRRSTVQLIFLDSGFQLYFFYRLSRHLYLKYHSRRVFWIIPELVRQAGRILTGSSIHPASRIGQGFKIAYGIGIVIGSEVVIGRNVSIFSGVSIGSATPGMREIKQPQIGDNVKIGANSVVISSFGDDVTVAGIPATVVKTNGRREKKLIEACEMPR